MNIGLGNIAHQKLQCKSIFVRVILQKEKKKQTVKMLLYFAAHSFGLQRRNFFKQKNSINRIIHVKIRNFVLNSKFEHTRNHVHVPNEK